MYSISLQLYSIVLTTSTKRVKQTQNKLFHFLFFTLIWNEIFVNFVDPLKNLLLNMEVEASFIFTWIADHVWQYNV